MATNYVQDGTVMPFTASGAVSSGDPVVIGGLLGVALADVADTERTEAETSTKKTGAKKVVMYSAEWCGVCTKAKKYFRSKKIPFKERDIDKSKKARKAFDKLNGKGIPVILVGKKRMNGFSVKRFESIYKEI